MVDPYQLERFVQAQDAGGAYARALAELRAGYKVSHWMWFVFPQIAGLGSSAMARRYAISSLDEARAYLAHPVLGPRLRECAATVAGLNTGRADDVFGDVDALKLRSSMTLFLRAAPDRAEFSAVLRRFFDDEPDPETDRRLFGGDGTGDW
jgi:uncharacterized protein (DUF1810 family)